MPCGASTGGGMARLRFPALVAPSLVPTQQVCGAQPDLGMLPQAVAFCIWEANPEPGLMVLNGTNDFICFLQSSALGKSV